MTLYKKAGKIIMDDGKLATPGPDCSCEYNDLCGDCFAANQTPKYIEVTFSGVKFCADDTGICQLGRICLETDTPPFGDWECIWTGAKIINIPGIGATNFDVWYRTDCTNNISALLVTTPGVPIYNLFSDPAVAGSPIVSPMENLYEKGDCGAVVRGYGGSATVVNPCA